MPRSVFIVFSCFAVICVGYHTSLRCGINQESKCVRACEPENTCRTRGVVSNCKDGSKRCEQKCVCKDGYYRNAVGDCITNEQCDMCQGDHEYFACSTACDNECSMLHVQNKTNCPIVNVACNRKCYCEDGYARDHKGNCVPIENCPPRTCGPNEVHVQEKCSCPPETCFSIVARFNCVSNQTCSAGCACMPGFLRLKPDTPCIPLCECPEMRNSPDCNKPGKYPG